MLASKPYLRLILFAVILRLLIMPILFHPDIKTQYYHANFLSQGVFNIYQYIEQNKDNLPYSDTFNYPPLAYYTLGGWNYLVSPFLGQTFQNWLFEWREGWYTNPQIFRQLFVLKIPYLLADLAVGFLLIKILNEKYRRRALTLWFFNPVSLYIIYALANFDIFPTLLTLLAAFYFKKKKFFSSGLSLGLGAALKLFPLLFLPFFLLALYREKSYREVLRLIAGCFGVFALSATLMWPGIFNVTGSGLVGKMLEIKVTVSPSLHIPLFYILYGLLLSLAAFGKERKAGIEFFILSVTLMIFSVTRFHPQWFLWSLPFLIFFVVRKARTLYLLIPLLLSYLVLILGFQDNFLTLGILGPVFPLIYSAGSLEQTLFNVIDKAQTVMWAQLTLAVTVGLILLASYREGRYADRA